MSTKTTILCSRQKDLRGGRGREADTESRWQKLSGRGREKSFPTKHIAELRGTLPSWKTRRWEKTTLHVFTAKAEKKNLSEIRFCFKRRIKRKAPGLSLPRWAVSQPSSGRVFGFVPGSARHFTAHWAHRARIDSATDTRRDLSIYKPQRNGLLSKILPAPKAGNLKGIVTGISLLPFSLPRWHGEGWALVCELLAW